MTRSPSSWHTLARHLLLALLLPLGVGCSFVGGKPAPQPAALPLGLPSAAPARLR